MNIMKLMKKMVEIVMMMMSLRMTLMTVAVVVAVVVVVTTTMMMMMTTTKTTTTTKTKGKKWRSVHSLWFSLSPSSTTPYIRICHNVVAVVDMSWITMMKRKRMIIIRERIEEN